MYFSNISKKKEKCEIKGGRESVLYEGFCISIYNNQELKNVNTMKTYPHRLGSASIWRKGRQVRRPAISQRPRQAYPRRAGAAAAPRSRQGPATGSRRTPSGRSSRRGGNSQAATAAGLVRCGGFRMRSTYSFKHS